MHSLSARAGFLSQDDNSDRARLRRALTRATHLDDVEQIDFLRALLSADDPPAVPAEGRERLRFEMFSSLLWGYRPGEPPELAEGLRRLWVVADARADLLALLEVRRAALLRPTHRMEELPFVPLRVHGTYSLGEALAGLGLVAADRPRRVQAGVFHLADLRADAFFVTLHKTEAHYSPSTMYRDYALSRDLFHWESQSTTSPGTPTGRRYIEHRARGHTILLFARAHKRGRAGTNPYVFLGPAEYVRHEGSRPIAFTWRLRRPMPPGTYREARLARA